LLWSYDKLVQYSALTDAAADCCGSKAETLDQSQKAYELAREPKELFLVEGGKHFDFYDRPEFVDPAIERIDPFFKAHL
jgi:hypothetical protein